MWDHGRLQDEFLLHIKNVSRFFLDRAAPLPPVTASVALPCTLQHIESSSSRQKAWAEASKYNQIKVEGYIGDKPSR
jgi:hypothetical protein